MSTTSNTAPLHQGDLAPAISLLDVNGDSVNLTSKWANGPTLLTFLRHFG